MSSLLGWLFGSEKKDTQSARQDVASEELKTALDEHAAATQSAEETVAATERVNRALRATAAAIQLAADRQDRRQR